MVDKRSFGPLLAILLVSSFGAAAAQTGISHPTASRLAGDWRSSPSVTIPASAAPAPVTSLGVAPSGARLERMLLLLDPSAGRQQALSTELQNQQDPKSPEYHHWLTPAAFAAAYANSPADVAAVSEWLQSQGFKVAPLPASLGWIEFSGTATQVEQAFHARLESAVTSAGTRPVLATGIAVPAALKPLIHGLVSLDGAVSAPAMTGSKPVAASAADLAAETSLSNAEAFTPQLVAQFLHLDALHAAGVTGAGETVAIATRSNVDSGDIAAFRSAFGLPASPISVVSNGSDPGQNADQAAATLAASWAGVAAPGAQILLVPAATTSATDGLDLSLAAIVDQALAHTVAVGYSACEAALSEAHQAFYAALYRQAAAEGIAAIAATGDSGPSACHAAGSDAPVSTGYGVNALASTPWNTAVGVAAFGAAGTPAGNTLAAWSPVSTADPAYAGGGGRSTLYASPSWQPLPTSSAVSGASDWEGSAGPTSSFRLLPDLALPTALDSGANRGLAFCLSGSEASGECTLVRGGGSSAAAALFAGIAALVAQKNGAQGNLAPNLYTLSRANGVFDDVQLGSARLACAAGSPDCGSTAQIGFAAASGYDLATGLGSINAQALVNQWAKPAVGSGLVTVTITSPTGTTTINPSQQITIYASVAASNGGTTPTGSVTFLNTSNSNTPLSTTDSGLTNGTTSLTTEGGFILGNNQIVARYNGDLNYEIGDSPEVDFYSQLTTTSLATSLSDTSPTAGESITVTGTLTTSGQNNNTVAISGTMTLKVDGVQNSQVTLSSCTTSSCMATFPLTVPALGQHTLQLVYSGDSNYAGITPSSYSITVARVATSLAVAPATTTPVAGSSLQLTATITPLASTSSSPSGTVTFSMDGTTVGSTGASGTTVSISITTPTSGTHSLVAVYAGDGNFSGSTSPTAHITVTSLIATSTTVSPSTTTPPAGASFTVSATVTPASTGSASPSGTVTFALDGSTVGSAALGSSTTVSTKITAPSSGTHSLVAAYSGDSIYNGSTSSSVALTVSTGAIATTTVLTPSTLSPATGGSMTVTVDISAVNPVASLPSGSVTITEDGTSVATGTVVPGSPSTATVTIPLLSAGTHLLQATYSGDNYYAGSTSTAVSIVAAKGVTVTSLTANPAMLTAGEDESFTATVAPQNPVSGTTYTITGTVSFYDGTTLLGTVNISANAATLAGAKLADNVSHSITAVYSGDNNWLASTSTALTLAATTVPDNVVLTSNLSTVQPGEALVLTATVTPTTPPLPNAEQNPTGNVIFYNGTTVIGEASLTPVPFSDASTATLTIQTLPGGLDTLSAYYLGDLTYDPEASNYLTLTIEAFTITPAPTNPATNLNIVKGSAGSASFVITGFGGFNGQVSIICTVATQDDMTCTASPQQVVPTATVTFVVQTFSTGATTTAANRKRDSFWPHAAGGTALALLAFFLLPFGRRARTFTSRSAKRYLILLLLLVGLGGAGIGCNNVTTVTGSGTPLGVATVQVVGVAYVDNTVVSQSVFFTVNVTAAP